MKKSLIIMLLTLTILCITATYVFAENSPLSLQGKQVVPGSTGTVNVKISSSDTIGVVSGVIGYDSNITSVEVSGKNNWTVTYNSETGQFNAYKAEGTKQEEIIQIKYTASNAESTGKITLKDLKVTNINYETEEISNITKEITIKNSTTNNPTTDNPTTDNPATNNPGSNQSETPTDKPTNDNENKDKNVKETTSNITTTSTKTLPYAGIMTYAVLPISIVLVGAISVGAYMGFRKYRGIK